MLGFRYLKVSPTTFVVQYRRGRIVRQGAGLAFFYFGPNSVIVQVPAGSVDVPFVFEEVTADFQDAAIQGQITYRVSDPVRLASLLDFSIDRRGMYASEDPDKLRERLILAAQSLARSFAQARTLDELIVSSNALTDAVLQGLRNSEVVTMLGLEVIGLFIQSIKPAPEMAKALQASARESLLRVADQAVYDRRNAAVELERKIKESELNTEIAVEQKRRQVRESRMAADIAVEEQRASLVERQVANERKEAESRGYSLRTTLEPLKDVDWRTLLAANGQLDARQMIAMAFRDLADNAQKIGRVNISPQLLESLLDPQHLTQRPEPSPRRQPPTDPRR